jgi:hypothetical protein
MTDPYTIHMRLCDDEGMVSHEPIEEEMSSADKTYLDRLNRLRNMTLIGRGDKPETLEEPFSCTGNAHLAGEHFRCTSPAHGPKPQAYLPNANLTPVGTILPFKPGRCPRIGWELFQGQILLVEDNTGISRMIMTLFR